MIFIKKIFYGLLALIILSGCSHIVETNFDPEFTSKTFSKVYIQKGDNDNKFHVYREIKDELELLGYEVSVGTEKTPKYPVDLILTYQDRWYWDMTMYLLELNIQAIDPDGYVSLADSKVRRTSLIRKNRKEMVKEVFSELFFKPEEREIYMAKTLRAPQPVNLSSVHLYIANIPKQLMETITAFYKQSGINFEPSKLKYPKKGVNYIASVHKIRTKSYFQIRERESEKLVAEAMIVNLSGVEESNDDINDTKGVHQALGDLHQALKVSEMY